MLFAALVLVAVGAAFVAADDRRITNSAFPEPVPLELRSCNADAECVRKHLYGHLMAAPVVLQEQENKQMRAELQELRDAVAVLEGVH